MPINYFSRRCVEGCDQFGSPPCPVCTSGQICSLLAPTCDECQRTVCVPQTAAPVTISTVSKISSSSSHEAGAIAGGVIAGIVMIAITIYFVWRNCIKAKRSLYQNHDWSDDGEDPIETEKSFNTRREARASTHTVASLASTVFTRASNIIQIAYIPGVTNRSCPTTPGFLVPPVPPIPLALTSNYGGSPSFEQEHFFMPSDLRDSTYSNMSSQTSLGRASVASTIYGNNAIISSISAQKGIRGKAAVVSVKSSAASETGIPPLPDYSLYDGGIPSPAFSIGTTFLSRASEATQGKAQVVRVRNHSDDHKYYLPSDLSSQASQTTSFIDNPVSPSHRSYLDSFSDLFRSEKFGAVAKDMKTNSFSNLKTPFGDENQMKEK